jgi:hypothetical protein
MKLFTIFAFIFLISTNLLAQPTGLTYPGTGTSFAQGTGNGPWTTPENITANAGRALSTAFSSLNDRTDQLRGTNFGLNIPVNAVILGIELEVSRSINGTNPVSNVVDNEIQLIKGGVVQPENKANLILAWPAVVAPITNDVIEVYGGPADLWNNTWTAADINAVDFGVALVARRFQVSGGARRARVRSFRVNVYWSNPLPIVLKSFDVRKVNVTSSQISWVTAEEINVKNYEVQRSSNGINFSTIAEVTPKSPNSNFDISYDVTDSKPLPGINYYRLKQTDIDGKFEIFGIKSVTFENKDTFFKLSSLDNRIKVTSANKKGTYYLLIRDTQGRLLQQQKLDLQGSVNETYVNLNPNVKGVVFVTLNGVTEQKSFRLFIQ